MTRGLDTAPGTCLMYHSRYYTIDTWAGARARQDAGYRVAHAASRTRGQRRVIVVYDDELYRVDPAATVTPAGIAEARAIITAMTARLGARNDAAAGLVHRHAALHLERLTVARITFHPDGMRAHLDEAFR